MCSGGASQAQQGYGPSYGGGMQSGYRPPPQAMGLQQGYGGGAMQRTGAGPLQMGLQSQGNPAMGNPNDMPNKTLPWWNTPPQQPPPVTTAPPGGSQPPVAQPQQPPGGGGFAPGYQPNLNDQQYIQNLVARSGLGQASNLSLGLQSQLGQPQWAAAANAYGAGGSQFDPTQRTGMAIYGANGQPTGIGGLSPDQYQYAQQQGWLTR